MSSLPKPIKAFGTWESISKSLFYNSPKKDTPKMDRTPVLSSGSPVSVTTKTLLTDIDIIYDALSPDGLFKLLKELQWKVAVSRIAQYQGESSRWVKNYDDKNFKMLWRRLPIHEACIRQPTAEVIAALLDSYPPGAKAKDNQGRTPLHYAVIHGAHIDVIHLLLHASYDVILAQDFFFKIPKDYAHTTTFTHKAEVIAALTRKNKQDIAVSAAGVRVLIQASHPTHGAGRNDRTPVLDEELHQSLAEVDAAYTMRDVALVNGEVFRMQLREMKEKLIGQGKRMEEMNEIRERNENCIFLLEKKHHHVVTAAAKKDEEIHNLQKQAEKDKQQRHADVVMRNKLKITVSSLTERLNGNNEESVEYWKLKAGKWEASNNEAEEKRRSLEELVKVYQDRSRDFEEKFNSVKVHIAIAESAALQTSSMEKEVASSKLYKRASEKELSEIKSICTESAEKSGLMEDLLYASEAASISVGKQIAVLEEDLAKSRQEAAALKSIVKTYHAKVSHVEECVVRLTGHLAERIKMLNAADSTVHIVEEELHSLVKDNDNAEARITILEDLVCEYDQQNHILEEKSTACEEELEALFKFRDDAEAKIASLEELVSGYEDNAKLNLKYTSYKIQNKSRMQACKSEFQEQISPLGDVVKMYRNKSPAIERASTRSTNTVSRMSSSGSRRSVPLSLRTQNALRHHKSPRPRVAIPLK